jgi:hypothetical protein
MGLGGFAVMTYTLSDMINQYSLIGIPLVILVIASLVGRWWVMFR